MLRLSAIILFVSLTAFGGDKPVKQSVVEKTLLAQTLKNVEAVKKGEYHYFPSILSSLEILTKLEKSSIKKYRTAVSGFLGDSLKDLETAALKCLRDSRSKDLADAALVLGKVCSSKEAIPLLKELSFTGDAYLQYRCYLAMTYLDIPGAAKVLTAMALSGQYNGECMAESLVALRMVDHKTHRSTALKIFQDLSAAPIAVVEAIPSVRQHNRFLPLLTKWLERDFPDTDAMDGPSAVMERRLLICLCSELLEAKKGVEKDDRIKRAIVKLAGYKSWGFSTMPIVVLEKVYADKAAIEKLLKASPSKRKKQVLEACLQRLK